MVSIYRCAEKVCRLKIASDMVKWEKHMKIKFATGKITMYKHFKEWKFQTKLHLINIGVFVLHRYPAETRQMLRMGWRAGIPLAPPMMSFLVNYRFQVQLNLLNVVLLLVRTERLLPIVFFTLASMNKVRWSAENKCDLFIVCMCCCAVMLSLLFRLHARQVSFFRHPFCCCCCCCSWRIKLSCGIRFMADGVDNEQPVFSLIKITAESISIIKTMTIAFQDFLLASEQTFSLFFIRFLFGFTHWIHFFLSTQSNTNIDINKLLAIRLVRFISFLPIILEKGWH